MDGFGVLEGMADPESAMVIFVTATTSTHWQRSRRGCSIIC
jgi:hypothetical protein